jgi:hypothetical protein
VSTEDDWRIEIDGDGGDLTALDRLVDSARARIDAFGRGSGEQLGDEIVVTHDGNRAFIYAASAAALTLARKGATAALGQQGVSVPVMKVSHWDANLRDWRQTEPPLTPRQEGELRVAASHKVTRTVVCVAGALLRDVFETRMTMYAKNLGLECMVITHRHLLSSQLGFQVTGVPLAVDEFERYVKSEARMSMRVGMGFLP